MVIEITEEQLEKEKDKYLDMVESGFPVLLKKKDGGKQLMVPQDPNKIQGICDI
tara:strand:- start:2739 stop:2900 length:162 start_codon:yes stop_codon:yes gene_type:complete